jgi:hypothetical protein
MPPNAAAVYVLAVPLGLVTVRVMVSVAPTMFPLLSFSNTVMDDPPLPPAATIGVGAAPKANCEAAVPLPLVSARVATTPTVEVELAALGVAWPRVPARWRRRDRCENSSPGNRDRSGNSAHRGRRNRDVQGAARAIGQRRAAIIGFAVFAAGDDRQIGNCLPGVVAQFGCLRLGSYTLRLHAEIHHRRRQDQSCRATIAFEGD